MRAVSSVDAAEVSLDTAVVSAGCDTVVVSDTVSDAADVVTSAAGTGFSLFAPQAVNAVNTAATAIQDIIFFISSSRMI